MVAAGIPFREALNYLRFFRFGRKKLRNRKSRFSKFSAPDDPPRPQDPQNRKNQTQNMLANKFSARIALRMTNSGRAVPRCSFPAKKSPPKKLGILTKSPTKNPGNATERRVLKSYHDGFQSQTKRCHLSQVMLISVLDKRFGVRIGDAKCLGELVWVS